MLADSFHLALGDLPTWGLFIGAVAAALITLRQLTIQRRDSAALNRQLIRQQADDIDTTWLDGSAVMVRSDADGDSMAVGKVVVVVSNGSKRPIRTLHCWLETRGSKERLMPLGHGPVTEDRRVNRTHAIETVPLSGTGLARAPVLRPGSTYGFVFEMTPEDVAALSAGFRLSSRPMVLFTDDAGNMWRIDDDLRLWEVPRTRFGSRGVRAWLAWLFAGSPKPEPPRWLRPAGRSGRVLDPVADTEAAGQPDAGPGSAD